MEEEVLRKKRIKKVFEDSLKLTLPEAKKIIFETDFTKLPSNIQRDIKKYCSFSFMRTAQMLYCWNWIKKNQTLNKKKS